MFTEKEKEILQALLESEIVNVLDDRGRGDSDYRALMTGYRLTLIRILFKLNRADADVFNEEYSDMVNSRLISRQQAY